MTYSWEWLSDLAIIPAWECVLVGVLVGIVLTLGIMAAERKRHDK